MATTVETPMNVETLSEELPGHGFRGGMGRIA
jgi:hypothetical protein